MGKPDSTTDVVAYEREPSVTDTPAVIGRQPILDTDGQLFGYELLYRRTAILDDTNFMTRSVIADLLTSFDLASLANEKRLFVNVTADALQRGYLRLLPPDKTVVELLENFELTDEILEACRELKQAGYLVALDDVTSLASVEHALDVVDIIKVDMLDTGLIEQARLAKACKERNLRLLAEKVEDRQVVERSTELGYSLFQGYFFCRPASIVGSSLSTQRVSLLRLIARLARRDHDLDSLEEVMLSDPTLCYQFLRMINSSYYGFRSDIKRIKHAMVLMGISDVQRWAMLLAMTSAVDGHPTELMRQSLIRARFCELRLSSLDGGAPEDGFLIGLLSVLDVLAGRPMSEIVDPLPLGNELKDALCGARGPLRDVLEEAFAAEIDPAGVAGNPIDSNRIFVESLRWADSTMRTCEAVF